MNFRLITPLTLLLACWILIDSCKKKEDEPEANHWNIDTNLFACSVDSMGFVWYKNSDTILDRGLGSGHYDPQLRTRYNETAAKMLDANGQVLAGSVFPMGSLIVKELFDSTGAHVRYAIMFKDPASPHADAYGWVWGVYRTYTSDFIEVATVTKGADCTGCHSGILGNIDLTTMHYSHP